ncbi:uncharacterized protein PF3D7_1120000-like [Palaemon carinicauda]|uniref:uncharacterized protein PF3D7_1120000-like n=1 Tax=Palaemon carinicauda TaxID=392227 RepID=UPI0035B5E06A
MAVGTKLKQGKVVVEKFEDHDESGTESEEPGDDMVEVKEEVLDCFDDSIYESEGVLDVSSEVKSEDDDITEITNGDSVTGNLSEENGESSEIKEEEEEEESGSDGISKDSDIEFEDDSDNDIPKTKKKVKEKEEKHVRIMTEKSDESDESDESDGESNNEDTEVKKESDTEEKTGLATVMAQILATRGGNNLILSKAKKDDEPVKAEETGEFELVDADGNVKNEVKIEVVDEEDERERAHKKQLQREILVKKLKLKPNIETDREKERNLRIIATQ